MTVKEFNLKIVKTILIYFILSSVIYFFTNNLKIAFILSIFFIELLYGSWLIKDNFASIIIPRNITKVWKPSHYKSNHTAMYKRDEYGLRGDFNNISEIKIVTIGGSTTDERWIDEKLTWSYLLQEELKKFNLNIKIANAGVDGQSSLGHLNNFEMWFNKINNFKPKYFLLYVGINDAAVLLKNYKSNNKLEKFIFRSDYLTDKKILDKVLKYFKNNSFLYKIIKIKIGHNQAKKYNLIHTTESWVDEKKSKPLLINMDENTELSIKEFKVRLYDLIKAVKKFNAQPILITQILGKNHVLFNCLKLINFETKKFCNKENISCIPLDEKNNIFTDEDFYDEVHTRPSGNKKIAAYIANEIHNILNL